MNDEDFEALVHGHIFDRDSLEDHDTEDLWDDIGRWFDVLEDAINSMDLQIAEDQDRHPIERRSYRWRRSVKKNRDRYSEALQELDTYNDEAKEAEKCDGLD